jgi:TonB family protein
MPRLRVCLWILSLAAALAAGPSTENENGGRKPISREGLLKAIEIGGLSADELMTYIGDLGVEFQINDQDRQLLVKAGLDDRVIKAISQNYRAPQPAVDERARKIAELSSGPAFAKEQIVALLKGGTEAGIVEQVVDVRGINFQLTPETAKEIESAGGNRGLLGVMFLKQPAPASPSSKQVQPARLIKQTKPEYPAEARRLNLQGAVRIELTVGETGRVERAKTLHGHPLLAAAAEFTVRQWVYEPALIDGKPARATAEVELNFKLN